MPTANDLDYSEIFQTVLDEQFVQESTTGWMEANASQVRYNGGNKIKVPKITVEGMGNYSRSSGFPDGAVAVDWEERTLTQDRGKEFNLDSQDYDETNFVAGAGVILGEFQKTKVVPEVDAYRFSKIFALANAGLRSGSYTPAAGTIYGQLMDDIEAIQDVLGENEPLVIAISYGAANVLDKSDDIEKHISIDDFANGSLQTKVRSLNGIPMFRIPGDRFKTSYSFSATNGFAATAVAMKINWIIASRAAIIAIVKTDKVRTFNPDANQEMDAWKVQVRKYHDLWILDNKLPCVWVSYTPISAPALSATIAQGSASGTTKATITAGTGNTLGYSKSASELTTVKYNDVPTGLTAYTSAADISITAGQYLNLYELDAQGHVVKFLSHLSASGEIKS